MCFKNTLLTLFKLSDFKPLFQKPTSYINHSTDQHYRSFPVDFSVVLLFTDTSTAILTLTEKLVKKVKNLLKTLGL